MTPPWRCATDPAGSVSARLAWSRNDLWKFPLSPACLSMRAPVAARGGAALAEVPPLPDLHVPVVLGECGGEDVRAVVAADEVEEGHFGRAGGGAQAGQPGRTDRARRQA